MFFRSLVTILQSHNQHSRLLKLICKLLESAFVDLVVQSVLEVTFCLFRGQTAVHSVWEVIFCLVSGQTVVLTEELHCSSENGNRSSFLGRGCHGKDLSCGRWKESNYSIFSVIWWCVSGELVLGILKELTEEVQEDCLTIVDEGIVYLWNIRSHSPSDLASYSRKRESCVKPLWEPHVLHA